MSQSALISLPMDRTAEVPFVTYKRQQAALARRRHYPLTIFYRCTQFRGKCSLPYIREEGLGDRLGVILRDIQIPDAVLAQIQELLLADKGREEETRTQRSRVLEQRLAQLHRRMDQAYQDKLDGKISEEFWARKSAEWQTEEGQTLASIRSLKGVQPERRIANSQV